MKKNINKKHYVYTIKDNKTDEILYIGETSNIRLRLNCHVANSTTAGSGLFRGMRDKIKMEVVKEFDIRSDAFAYQCQLQNEYGFKSDCEKLREKCINENGEYFINLPDVIERRIQAMKDAVGLNVVVYQRKTGKLIGEYQTMNEACDALGVDRRNATKALKGVRYKSAGGYVFKYV